MNQAIQVHIGDWVKIHAIVLAPADRAPNIPEETSRVPLEMWVKGHVTEIGSDGQVAVRTMTGRIERGTVTEVNPTYSHSFGHFVPEILRIGRDLKEFLYEK
ncbi:MAG: 2-amino-4-oxopentanoate thiolase subunit OrtA [Bacillota bacterium]|nr:2-amino-4-oxopentanoate thiolase subunit OrtA [Bacillota bacterium]